MRDYELGEVLVKKIQSLLKFDMEYDGQIDGDIGPKTLSAVTAVLRRTPNPHVLRYTIQRKCVAAAQIILSEKNYRVGSIDGYWGNETEGAYLEWEAKVKTGKPLALDRIPIQSGIKHSEFPAQSNVGLFYGAPGDSVRRQLIRINTPFTLRLDFDLDTFVNQISIHRKCADSAVKALELILDTYGKERIHALGLDRFAGSYVHRKMRGGSAWSMHAYGCAIDWFALPNGLTMRCPEALFCKSEYQAWLDIWEYVGWTSLGRAIGRDYMHVQAASL